MLRREAEEAARLIATSLPSTAPLDMAARELADAAAALARQAVEPRPDPLPAIAAAAATLRDDAAAAVRRIEAASRSGGELLAEAPALLREAAEAIAATAAEAASRIAGLAESEAAAAQRAAVQAAGEAAAALLQAGTRVANDAEAAGARLARGAAVLEDAARDLARIAEEAEAGSSALRQMAEQQAASHAQPCAPGTAAHAALSGIEAAPPVLRATLARLGEVDGEVRALLAEAETLAVQATEAAAPMPEAVQAHTPALLDSLEATIGRLRSVATALALAGDAASRRAA
jgi:hypothetical protein